MTLPVRRTAWLLTAVCLTAALGCAATDVSTTGAPAGNASPGSTIHAPDKRATAVGGLIDFAVTTTTTTEVAAPTSTAPPATSPVTAAPTTAPRVTTPVTLPPTTAAPVTTAPPITFPPTPSQSNGKPSPRIADESSLSDTEKIVLERVNAARVGRAPLVLEIFATQTARTHSSEMAAKGADAFPIQQNLLDAVPANYKTLQAIVLQVGSKDQIKDAVDKYASSMIDAFQYVGIAASPIGPTGIYITIILGG